jgi:spermidine synthase
MTVNIGDGIEYCKRKDLAGSFDVVIIDSSDPDGPAEGLFNKEFMTSVFDLLKPGGVMCQQVRETHSSLQYKLDNLMFAYWWPRLVSR